MVKNKFNLTCDTSMGAPNFGNVTPRSRSREDAMKERQRQNDFVRTEHFTMRSKRRVKRMHRGRKTTHVKIVAPGLVEIESGQQSGEQSKEQSGEE